VKTGDKDIVTTPLFGPEVGRSLNTDA